MNKILLRKVAIILCFLPFLLITSASAQDIHFSQFYNAPSNLNPALSGIFHGDERIALNYRNQWANVPVDYLTFAAAYDRRISPKFLNNKTIGISGYFLYDRAGDSSLYNSKIGISGAYIHKLNKKNALSGGLGLALTLRGFDDANLRYNSQFNGELYNPDLDPGEANFQKENNLAYADLSAGINWHHKKSKSTRGKLDLGVGIFHFNLPKDTYYDNSERLDPRFSLYIDGVQQLSRKFDLLGRGLINLKGKESEAIVGVAARFYIEPSRAKPLAIQLGISHRLFKEGDAWIPNAELLYKAWTVGFSYDVNVSDFSTATNRRGGPELALIYRMAKAKQLENKNCKIF